MQYKGVEIPEKFIEIAICKGIKSVGIYNGKEHRFFSPFLNPNRAELDEIKTAFEEYRLFPDRDEFDSVYRQIRNNLSDAPEVIDVNELKESELETYDRVVFTEEDGSETDTVYVGDNSFFVLSTTKSSLQNADIIRCISMPMSVRDKEKFTITRDGQAFVPMAVKYPPTFRTHPLGSIKILRSPFLYRIIDGEDRFGGRKINDVKGDILENWTHFYDEVSGRVLSHEKDSLPEREIFPDYDILLSEAKVVGIGSYILDVLIENIESRNVHKYCFNNDEWEADPRQKKIDYEGNQKKAIELYKRKVGELDKQLKSLKQRRVLFFFKAAAKASPTVHEAIENIIRDLDALADEAESCGYVGVGTKGVARATYDQAKLATKPERFENLKTAGVLLAVIAAGVFVGWSWYSSSKNSELYKASETAVMSRLDKSKDFDSITAELDSAYFAFRPAYTRFVIRESYSENRKVIEAAKEAHIDKMVSSINTMLNANRGKFNKYSEEALFRLLEVAPDDEDALELKERWMNN